MALETPEKAPFIAISHHFFDDFRRVFLRVRPSGRKLARIRPRKALAHVSRVRGGAFSSARHMDMHRTLTRLANSSALLKNCHLLPSADILDPNDVIDSVDANEPVATVDPVGAAGPAGSAAVIDAGRERRRQDGAANKQRREPMPERARFASATGADRPEHT